MKNIPTIPLTLSYCDRRNENPNHVIDGNWGGMGGDQIWFNGVDKKNPKNVFELSEYINKETGIIKRCYHRVWDDKKEIWRKLTKREKENFVLSDRKYVDHSLQGFNGIVFPEFKRYVAFPSPLRGLINVQPMNEPTGSVWFFDIK